jgi:hypothetical protein
MIYRYDLSSRWEREAGGAAAGSGAEDAAP